MPLYVMAQFKFFCATESEVNGARPATIARRFHRGKYGWLIVHRYSHRDIRITGTTLPAHAPVPCGYLEAPPDGAIQFKEWLTGEADALGIKPHTLYMRVKRGRHPAPEFFRGGRLRNEYVVPVKNIPQKHGLVKTTPT